ncbi:MAG TPA: carboxymuconolactone decarboxylase family protein [Acidimicrobiia bacterium]|nr:carboxymuconolactone decarboxylase family protein [Acidimicrobiia bacterium]
MTEPRIPPVDLDALDDETRALLEPLSQVRGSDVRVLNVFTTLAQHPKLMKRWLVFANHVLGKSTLDARARELAILRTGWRCNAPYEWGQHVAIARAVGVTDDEIARIAAGPDADGWSPRDTALLRAVDELHDTATVTDATWRELTSHYGTQELMDLVFAIGQYHLVSFALNAFGVERDDGVTGVPFPRNP